MIRTRVNSTYLAISPGSCGLPFLGGPIVVVLTISGYRRVTLIMGLIIIEKYRVYAQPVAFLAQPVPKQEKRFLNKPFVLGSRSSFEEFRACSVA